ncbi:MAG: polysaccharide deacetylase family protein [Clostridia bacterium]|nr:polysaccharide deacetylase family protein [Clostridia bacterium]
MQYLIVKRKYLLLFLTVVVLAVVLTVSIYNTPISAVYLGENIRLVPIYSVDTEEKQVAISFDSAWGADKTKAIVDTIKEYNVNATFFLVGFWTEDYPDMLKYIHDNGLEIGTHSNTHPDLTSLDSESIRLELKTSIDLIENIIGKDTVNLFRAPYGAYNNNLLNIAKDEFGLNTIQWDVDTLDWKGLTGVEICNRVMDKVKNGSIILCHNNSDHILDALPLMLTSLINAGYKVTSVGELIMHDNYYIDNLGIQRKNI